MNENSGVRISVTLDENIADLPTVLKLDLGAEVFLKLEAWAGDAAIHALEEISGVEIVCQLSKYANSATPQRVREEYSLCMLLREAPSSGETILCLIKRPRTSINPKDRESNPWEELPGVHLDHQEDNARVIVSIEGKLFTRYLYSPHLGKPYFYPLIGPYGITLVQDAPDDHLHHHGLWWGHDDVNGHKLYHEFRGEGRQVHQEFMVMAGGPVFGQLTMLIDWVDENGNLLLKENRSVRIYNLPPESRYMDLTTELHAVNGDVRFGPTKEGGFPFVRVNEQLNGNHTGTITAANGKVGESEIFGSVASWVDYSGRIFDRINCEGDRPVKEYTGVGIAVFAHPENATYASQWFVREYGPFTPANFHFCGGKVLSNGDSIAMKHRIFIHEGDVTEGKVAERHREYAGPVPAKLLLKE